MATQFLRSQTILAQIKSLKDLILFSPLKSHPSTFVTTLPSHKGLVKDRRRLTKLKEAATCLRMRLRSWITNSHRHSLLTYTKLLRINSKKHKISRVLQTISSKTNCSPLQHRFKNHKCNLKLKSNSPWIYRLNPHLVRINLLKDSSLQVQPYPHQLSDKQFLKTHNLSKLPMLNLCLISSLSLFISNLKN